MTRESERWQIRDVSGPTNKAYQIWAGERMVTIAFTEADADLIVREHNERAGLVRRPRELRDTAANDEITRISDDLYAYIVRVEKAHADYEQALTAERERADDAQARIATLESLVAVLAETNHDTHGTTGPWRKCDFASCMTAARALLSPAPADGTLDKT